MHRNYLKLQICVFAPLDDLSLLKLQSTIERKKMVIENVNKFPWKNVLLSCVVPLYYTQLSRTNCVKCLFTGQFTEWAGIYLKYVLFMLHFFHLMADCLSDRNFYNFFFIQLFLWNILYIRMNYLDLENLLATMYVKGCILKIALKAQHCLVIHNF